MPDGTCTLSSSTRSTPAWSRTMSIPAMWTRTPFGGSMPWAGRQKPTEVVSSDRGRPVDVGEKRLQRAHPLHDARFDQVPLGRRDQPGDQVEREDPLFAGIGEYDALVAEAAVPGLGPPRQVVAG